MQYASKHNLYYLYYSWSVHHFVGLFNGLPQDFVPSSLIFDNYIEGIKSHKSKPHFCGGSVENELRRKETPL